MVVFELHTISVHWMTNNWIPKMWVLKGSMTLKLTGYFGPLRSHAVFQRCERVVIFPDDWYASSEPLLCCSGYITSTPWMLEKCNTEPPGLEIHMLFMLPHSWMNVKFRVYSHMNLPILLCQQSAGVFLSFQSADSVGRFCQVLTGPILFEAFSCTWRECISFISGLQLR